MENSNLKEIFVMTKTLYQFSKNRMTYPSKKEGGDLK